MTTTKRRQSPRTKKASTTAAAKPCKPAPKSKNYTRPGVEAAARLVSLQPISNHVCKWERASSYYAAMIKAKGGAKLVKLDKQREDIAKDWNTKSAVNGNGTACMLSKEQLLNVMIEWKFSKGKPRNMLKPLLKSNSDASVPTAAKQAFETADGIPKNDASGEYTKQLSSAINHLCELKGVGPATASAVLCQYRPDIFAFMDDEVIECLYDGKRGYTLKIYMGVNDRCQEISAELNEARKNGEDEWTPCRVGKALWTLATMSATNDDNGLSAIFEDGDDGARSMEENEKSSNSRKRVKKG